MGLGGTANPLMAQDQFRSDLSIWLKPHSGNIPASGENATMKITSNSVRTAGYVELDNLREARYELLEGALEE